MSERDGGNKREEEMEGMIEWKRRKENEWKREWSKGEKE